MKLFLKLSGVLYLLLCLALPLCFIKLSKPQTPDTREIILLSAVSFIFLSGGIFFLVSARLFTLINEIKAKLPAGKSNQPLRAAPVAVPPSVSQTVTTAKKTVLPSSRQATGPLPATSLIPSNSPPKPPALKTRRFGFAHRVEPAEAMPLTTAAPSQPIAQPGKPVPVQKSISSQPTPIKTGPAPILSGPDFERLVTDLKNYIKLESWPMALQKANELIHYYPETDEAERVRSNLTFLTRKVKENQAEES